MKVKQYDDKIVIRVKSTDKDLYSDSVKSLFNMSVAEYVRDKLNEVLNIYINQRRA